MIIEKERINYLYLITIHYTGKTSNTYEKMEKNHRSHTDIQLIR